MMQARRVLVVTKRSRDFFFHFKYRVYTVIFHDTPQGIGWQALVFFKLVGRLTQMLHGDFEVCKGNYYMTPVYIRNRHTLKVQKDTDYAEGKKPDTKKYLLHDNIYMCSRMGEIIYGVKSHISTCLGQDTAKGVMDVIS